MMFMQARGMANINKKVMKKKKTVIMVYNNIIKKTKHSYIANQTFSTPQNLTQKTYQTKNNN